MTTPTRGRGRPATITAAELARTALELWDQRGYENVAMSEVAAAAGVNERTVFRYFASKSDIVWQVIGASFGDLQRHLAATPAGEPLMARIRMGVLASWEVAEDRDTTRLRMRVISRSAELRGPSSPQFTAWRTVIQEFAARHLGVPADDRTPLVVASCVQAAVMAALTWWGAHGEGTPSDAVDLALRDLQGGFTDRLLVDDHPRKNFLDRGIGRVGQPLDRGRPHQDVDQPVGEPEERLGQGCQGQAVLHRHHPVQPGPEGVRGLAQR
jgi:TetR/AcrR family transcriptional regulator, regulator of mycofactocin system